MFDGLDRIALFAGNLAGHLDGGSLADASMILESLLCNVIQRYIDNTYDIWCIYDILQYYSFM